MQKLIKQPKSKVVYKIECTNEKLLKKDILMVEKFIDKHTGDFKIRELFKNIPLRISWNYFKKIINHLLESRKIVYDSKNYLGYVWEENISEDD